MILGIDTALSACSVALLEGADVQTQQFQLIGRGHAEHLIPMVQTVLNDAQATAADLTGVAVSIGPGSFTGIRVGLAAAKAFALAWSVPCVGISTLSALAAAALDLNAFTEPFLVAIDANRGQVFSQIFSPVFNEAGRSFVALEEPVAEAPEASAARAQKRGALRVVGSGANLIQQAVPSFAVCSPLWPSAVYIARLSQDPCHTQTAQAFYVREHDARLPHVG